MKTTLLEVYKNSFLFEIICWITRVLIPRIKSDFAKSWTLKVILWIEKNIVSNKYFEIIFNSNKVTEAWCRSAFYRYTTYAIRRVVYYIPKSRFKFQPALIGIFILFVLLFPDRYWEDFYIIPLFAIISLLFISRYSISRIGVVFVMINTIIFLFAGMMAISIPFVAFKTMWYFMLAIDLFFLISFSIRSQEDLELMLLFFFIALVALCGIGIVQEQMNFDASFGIVAVYENSTVFAEIIILLFPFAFVYPITLKSKIRSLLYSILIMVATFIVVAATQSKGGMVAFLFELIVVIVIINRRYIPMIFVLAPTLTYGVIENIIAMWNNERIYGNFFQNIVSAARNFWSNGFGVNTENFVSMYNSAAVNYDNTNAWIKVPGLQINALYFNIVMDLGAIFIIGFMFYIVRIAHSSLTCMFRATSRQKIIFAAGLASLLGISLSTLFESNLFEPRVLIMYWTMLGLLRSGRIIRLGVLD